jgi:hypothetical protein
LPRHAAEATASPFSVICTAAPLAQLPPFVPRERQAADAFAVSPSTCFTAFVPVPNRHFAPLPPSQEAVVWTPVSVSATAAADEQVPVVPTRHATRAAPRKPSSTAFPTILVRHPAPAQPALTWATPFAAWPPVDERQ